MKHLLICRHAKSSWRDTTLSDRERPLNERGERDAPEMGQRLVRRGMHPDLIITSSAVRARATAEHLALQLAYPLVQVQVVDPLYAASVPSLLALLRDMEHSITTLCMVGHNPESTAFANMLGRLDIANIPTCGIVALEFPVTSWAEIEPGLGKLLFFDFPKNTGG